MKKTVLCVSAVLTFFTFLTEPLHSQTPTPNAGLTTVGVIPVPVWTPAGATSASFDLFSFNPLTRILYQADCRNHGALVIDTVTNTLQGIIKPPACRGFM